MGDRGRAVIGPAGRCVCVCVCVWVGDWACREAAGGGVVQRGGGDWAGGMVDRGW